MGRIFLSLFIVFLLSNQAFSEGRDPQDSPSNSSSTSSDWLIDDLVESLATWISEIGGFSVTPATESKIKTLDDKVVEIPKTEPAYFFLRQPGHYDGYTSRSVFMGKFAPGQLGLIDPDTKFTFTPKVLPRAVNRAAEIRKAAPTTRSDIEIALARSRRKPITQAERDRFISNVIFKNRRGRRRPLQDFEGALAKDLKRYARRFGLSMTAFDKCGTSISLYYLRDSLRGSSTCKDLGYSDRQIKSCFFDSRMQINLKCKIALNPARIAKKIGLSRHQTVACSEEIYKFYGQHEGLIRPSHIFCKERTVRDCFQRDFVAKDYISEACKTSLGPRREKPVGQDAEVIS